MPEGEKKMWLPAVKDGQNLSDPGWNKVRLSAPPLVPALLLMYQNDPHEPPMSFN